VEDLLTGGIFPLPRALVEVIGRLNQTAPLPKRAFYMLGGGYGLMVSHFMIQQGTQT
jgi:hypothetical protein